MFGYSSQTSGKRCVLGVTTSCLCSILCYLQIAGSARDFVRESHKEFLFISKVLSFISVQRVRNFSLTTRRDWKLCVICWFFNVLLWVPWSPRQQSVSWWEAFQFARFVNYSTFLVGAFGLNSWLAKLKFRVDIDLSWAEKLCSLWTACSLRDKALAVSPEKVPSEIECEFPGLA